MVNRVLDPEFCKLPCRVLMDKTVPTAEINQNLVDVIKTVKENYHGDIVALEDGEPVGCFNMFDVLKWLAESDLPRSEIKVENLICTPVITVNTGSTIEEAFDIMKKFDITSLAVTEKGKLKGYITDKGVKEWMNMYPHYLRYVQATKQSKCSELIEEIFRSGSPTS